EVVREVMDRFEDTCARAGSHLRLEAEGPIVGTWDRSRIEQVITNLLTNAIKYGASKPIDVMATSFQTRARLVVRDGGVRISLEAQARIFRRFERACPSRNYGGLGLGLWIVRQVIEAHGGTILVESEPGAGSTFTVDLPLRPAGKA